VRRCVFCGGAPLTNEDAIPKWVLELLPDPGEPSTVTRSESGRPPTTWEQQSPAVLHKVVCAPCNNGWMSDLEAATKPFLKSMILGHGRELHDTGRRLIAAWAVKTSVILQAPDKKSKMPQPYREAVKAHGSTPLQEPPPGAQVWLGAYDCTREDFLHRHDGLRLTGTESREKVYGYGATFNIGHAAFQVFWTELQDGARRDLAPAVAPALPEIWPQDRPVCWPPATIFNFAGLRSLADGSFVQGKER
jgi:hypothetical protein